MNKDMRVFAFRRNIPAIFLALAALPGVAAQKSTPSRKPVPARPAKATPAVGTRSALDKATLEAYIRHLFVWGPQIQVSIDAPKPAPLAGMYEVKVKGTAGPASQEQVLYVSRDGQKIVQGNVYDITLNPFQPELAKLKTDSQPSLGTPGAPVVLVLFTDFQCPYCRDEARMLRQHLVKTFPTQVRLYFKDLPLESIHNWAKTGAIAGRCVFNQDQAAFWEYHDWVFENQSKLNPENFQSMLMEFAGKKEIDTLLLKRCLETRATEAEVNRSMEEARSLQVNATPTLFVNGRRIPAQIAWAQLQSIIQFEIEYQKTAQNAGDSACCEVKLPTPFNN